MHHGQLEFGLAKFEQIRQNQSFLTFNYGPELKIGSLQILDNYSIGQFFSFKIKKMLHLSMKLNFIFFIFWKLMKTSVEPLDRVFGP